MNLSTVVEIAALNLRTLVETAARNLGALGSIATKDSGTLVEIAAISSVTRHCRQEFGHPALWFVSHVWCFRPASAS